MAALNFPNSPSLNDTHTENGVTFKWNGAAWDRLGDIGAQGSAGAAGAQGSAGAAGAQGSTGPVAGSSNQVVYKDGSNNPAGSANLTFDGTNLTVGGNVSIGGTFTYEDVTNIDSVGVVTARAGVKVPDSQKIFLGTGDDLEIYHDGNNSAINDKGTGNLYIQGSSNIYIRDYDTSESHIIMTKNGSVELYHDGNKRVETTNTGASVTGNLNISGHTYLNDNRELVIGAGQDLKLYHDGSNSRIKNVTGQLWLQSDNGIRFTDSGVNESMAAFYDNGAVELYYDGSKKFETTSYGANITGDLRISDNSARLHLYDMNAADNTACTGGFEVFDQNGNRGVFMGATESASNLHFGIRNDEKMRINYNGNIGIGENSPYYKLHLKTNNNTTSLSGGTGGNWGGDGIRIENENATGGSMVLAHFRNYDADWHIGGKYVGANDSDFIFLAESNERLRITSDGKVGVGVAAPSQMMEITNTSGTGSQIQLRDTSTANTSSSGARFGYNGSGAQIWNFESTYVRFATSNTERVRINSSGDFGIGTANPTNKLHVHSSSTTGEIRIGGGNGSGNHRIFIQAHPSTAYIDSYGNNTHNPLYINASPLILNTSGSGAVTFGTTTDNPGDGNTTTGSAIRSNGKYFFSCSNDGGHINRNNAGYVLHTRYNGAHRGGIYVFPNATQYNTSSDYRMKENVVDISGAITRIKGLSPRRFNFITEPGKTVDGFIAHEAATVVPEAVTGTYNEVDGDGNPVYQGIDNGKLVPLLTAALQEAIAKIETLEAAVATLQGS